MVPANPKERDKSTLIVLLEVVFAVCVASTHANHLLYCVVEYIPIGFAICTGIRGYKDVLLRVCKVVSIGSKACRRCFSRKRSYSREIL
jgi:hypothetical protein